ncbi:MULTISPECIES: regulator [Pseudovibrio]|uniref:regulator n=1 Tax=Stappiaceae TaxID=2821832 RepID=UPI0023652E4A|nr:MULTISPECIES: regulator [Pseudovibrio]MDD7910610.1 regulator [Pseudovibrio exalbescens]MDX5594551.1 regulator [Pseudovibrio sp. SPO723]
MAETDNTNSLNGSGEAPVLYILVGRGWEEEDGHPDDAVPFNILVTAADDDGAVRRGLEALTAQGFIEAELDQIGIVTERPEEDMFASAYDDAMAGNVAVIAFRD